LAARRPDVISAHDAPKWVLEAATRLGIPYVDTLHGMHSLFERDPTVEACRGKKLSRIVAVSELQRRQYLDLNPSFPRERIITIPNAVDDVRRVPGDREGTRTKWGIGDEYIFVSLARYCLQKNTYGLVAAFGEVASSHPNAHLIIAGRPDDTVYFKQVASLRETLPCRDRIHLRDHYPDPAELLSMADGFVLDSFFEGWSLASMEALYAGLPVVLSEVGGALEQIGSGGARGHVVANPLGDSLRVNWETIREARYARQMNRQMLVEAMSSLIVNRKEWVANRAALASESRLRFNPVLCLGSHAQVLAAAAGLHVSAG
jgi:glycosyltransferase involved in cell wall biosynthesis